MVYIKKQIIVYILIGCLLAGFHKQINDIEGNSINLEELASQKKVAVITMKSPDCPVCQTQILRIIDNFDKLSACNVPFIVIAPGPIEKLQKTKENKVKQKKA